MSTIKPNRQLLFIFLYRLAILLTMNFSGNIIGATLKFIEPDNHIAIHYNKTGKEINPSLFQAVPQTIKDQNLINEACFYLGTKNFIDLADDNNSSVWNAAKKLRDNELGHITAAHCMICIQRKDTISTKPNSYGENIIHDDITNGNTVTFTVLHPGEILITHHIISTDLAPPIPAVEGNTNTAVSTLMNHSFSATIATCIYKAQNHDTKISAKLEQTIKSLLNLSAMTTDFGSTNTFDSFPVHDLLSQEYDTHLYDGHLSLSEGNDADHVAHYMMAFAQLIKQTPSIAANLTAKTNAEQIISEVWNPTKSHPSNYLWGIFDQAMKVTAIDAMPEEDGLAQSHALEKIDSDSDSDSDGEIPRETYPRIHISSNSRGKTFWPNSTAEYPCGQSLMRTDSACSHPDSQSGQNEPTPAPLSFSSSSDEDSEKGQPSFQNKPDRNNSDYEVSDHQPISTFPDDEGSEKYAPPPYAIAIGGKMPTPVPLSFSNSSDDDSEKGQPPFQNKLDRNNKTTTTFNRENHKQNPTTFMSPPIRSNSITSVSSNDHYSDSDTPSIDETFSKPLTTGNSSLPASNKSDKKAAALTATFSNPPSQEPSHSQKSLSSTPATTPRLTISTEQREKVKTNYEAIAKSFDTYYSLRQSCSDIPSQTLQIDLAPLWTIAVKNLYSLLYDELKVAQASEGGFINTGLQTIMTSCSKPLHYLNLVQARQAQRIFTTLIEEKIPGLLNNNKH